MADRRSFKTRLFQSLELATYHVLRLMPVAMTSGVGAVLGRVSGRYFRKVATRRSRENLAKFRPDLSEAEIARRVGGMWGHIGRILTEFACYKTLRFGNYIEIQGRDALPPSGSPVVVAGSHLGSWEVITLATMAAGHRVAGTYQPQSNLVRNTIMMRERRNVGWISLDKEAAPMRHAIRHLDGGGAVVIYIDEYVNGLVNAPALGRDVKLDRNIALSARLACRADIPLVFAKCERLKGAQYRVTFERVEAGGDVAASIGELDRLLEAAVRERPEQWFMLHVLKDW